MPAKSRRKQLIFVVIIIIVCGLILLSYSFAIHNKRYKMIRSPLLLHEVIIKGDSVSENFEHLKLAFMNKNEVSLPYEKIKDIPTPITYPRWEYCKVGLFNGTVKIHDNIQNVFSGEYKIEVLEESQSNLRWKLSSEDITFIVSKQSFSMGDKYLELPGLSEPR